MSSTLNELVAELTGYLPGYSAFLARKDLAKAYRDICNRRTWSFLIGDGGFNAPAQIGNGTVTVTQNSQIVVADATAAAALDAAVTQTPTLTQRQFRISTAGAIYNILAWDTVLDQLTLDRPILEPSGANTSYLVYQCYFPPPPQALVSTNVYDFNRWVSVVDPINGYPLDLDTSKAWLDRRDPQRSCFDLAYTIYDYKMGPQTGAAVPYANPYYEFWPHPTQGQEFICVFKKKGLAFTVGTQSLPDAIPESLLIDRCLTSYTYRWAAMQAGREPKLAKTNWAFLMRDGQQKWEFDLQQAKLNDDNVYMQTLVQTLCGRGFPPIDARFLQSHSTGLEPFR